MGKQFSNKTNAIEGLVKHEFVTEESHSYTVEDLKS